MIDKMKKYQFLIYHKDYQSFLLKLRELGVLHVAQKQVGALSVETPLAAMIEKEKRYGAAIKSLHEINESKKAKELLPANRKQEGIQLLEEVENLFNEKDNLILDIQGKQKEIEKISPLGVFSQEDITRFYQRGWYIHFYSVLKSKFDQSWVEEYNAITFQEKGSLLYFFTFVQSEMAPTIEAEHIKMPETALSDIQKELDATCARLSEIEELLQKTAKEKIETLRYQQLQTLDLITFGKVELSGDAAAGEKLMLLEGYAPAVDTEKVGTALEKEAACYMISDPTAEDDTPIKLKNNKFARAFEMLTNLYDLPNYNAFDFTLFYAPFYIVFFGLCVGDCGYGLLFLIASFFIKRKATSDTMKTVGQLALFLGIGTLIAGFAGGSFFGFSLSDKTWSWIQPFQSFMFDSKKLFRIALVLGGIQITYALILKCITTWIRFGVLYVLDTFGWLLMVYGIATVYLLGKQGTITPELQKTLYIVISSVAGAMMLFFNNPERGAKGIPESVGMGLFGVFTKVSGLIGDLLSYIRLFALNISGAVLGMVFNFLAISFAPDTIILHELVFIIMFTIGHTLNIALSGLGAFVHPLRLTFVEFYNNAGFEGGGKTYTPFKKQAE